MLIIILEHIDFRTEHCRYDLYIQYMFMIGKPTLFD